MFSSCKVIGYRVICIGISIPEGRDLGCDKKQISVCQPVDDNAGVKQKSHCE